MDYNNKRLNLENSSSIIENKDKIEKEDRSPLVRDHDYGRIKSADIEKTDIPVYATIEYDKNGQIICEDYSKLEEVLNKVIANNVKDTNIRNPITNQKEVAKTIQGNVLTKLKLSEKEMEYAIIYISEQNILVRGTDSSLDGELENYQYTSTYKSTPLPEPLSNEQNKEIIAKIRKLKQDLLNAKDENQKKSLEKELKKTRDTIIEGNIRMVDYILSKSTFFKLNESEKEDIKQSGYEQLINIIDKYDLDKGYALSTALYNYLEHHVIREYQKNDTIRIPVHMQERISKILKIKKALEPFLGREMTPEEIAEELYISVSAVNLALEALRKQKIESLETSIADEEPNYDSPEDEVWTEEKYTDEIASSLPELYAANEDFKDLLLKALKNLTEREQMVLKMRFGLEGYESTHTLEEVAKKLGVHRERIRHIEANAIRKLRRPSRSKIMKEYAYGNEDMRDTYIVNPPKHRK